MHTHQLHDDALYLNSLDMVGEASIPASSHIPARRYGTTDGVLQPETKPQELSANPPGTSRATVSYCLRKDVDHAGLLSP